MVRNGPAMCQVLVMNLIGQLCAPGPLPGVINEFNRAILNMQWFLIVVIFGEATSQKGEAFDIYFFWYDVTRRSNSR